MLTKQRTYTFLLVEDNPDERGVVRQALAETGFPATLIEVDTLRAGLEVLRRKNPEERPDLVILDLGLPGVAGHDLEALFKVAEHHDGPVQLLSGLVDQRTIDTLRRMRRNVLMAAPKDSLTPRRLRRQWTVMLDPSEALRDMERAAACWDERARRLEALAEVL